MYVTIDIHYVYRDSRIMRGGNFPVNKANYQKDKMRESAIVAYKFIELIRSEQSEAMIEKVICNGEDITEYLTNNLQNSKNVFIITK
jgi:hypothetical protein